MAHKSTKEQADWLQNTFNHFNDWLFGGTLPNCLISIIPKQSSNDGCFIPRSLTDKADKEVIHEIHVYRSISDTGIIDFWLALVHQMLRCWQYTKGSKPRQGYSYHNTQLTEKAALMGITCEGVGKDVGKSYGQYVELRIEEEGLFMKTLQTMSKGLTTVPFKSRSENTIETPPPDDRRKRAYCPKCGWSTQLTKPNRGTLICPRCAINHPELPKDLPNLVIQE